MTALYKRGPICRGCDGCTGLSFTGQHWPVIKGFADARLVVCTAEHARAMYQDGGVHSRDDVSAGLRTSAGGVSGQGTRSSRGDVSVGGGTSTGGVSGQVPSVLQWK